MIGFHSSGRTEAQFLLLSPTAALRFLYHVTLKRGRAVEEIATSKKPRMLPVILSPDEVMRFLESIRSVKHRAILMTAYAAGLRMSEAISLHVPAGPPAFGTSSRAALQSR